MTLGLGEVAAVWPLGASLAAAVAARGLGAGRRRAALNEALHELRRPLQALALAAPAARNGHGFSAEGSLQLATTALERLEREINGEPAAPILAPVLVGPLLAAAVTRWRQRAALRGGSLSLREPAAEAAVLGDRCLLAQALDNLVVNAIEHGGPEVVVRTEIGRRGLRIVVADRGRERPFGSGRLRPTELIARLAGRHRHGHGLRIVRRTAIEHGGDFRLCRRERGTEAILELPLRDCVGVGA